MIVFGSRIDRDGPLFDGRAAAAVHGACEAIEQNIAEVGVHKVRTEFSHFVRHPTGYYESHITADRAFDGWEIHDSGVIYGPWLAGVGSRNKTSRFKGYPHWTLGIAAIHRDAQDIADFTMQRYLPRMR